MSKAGEFDIRVWVGGSPVWCTLRRGDQEIRISDTELSDLIYAARKAQEEANNVRRGFNEPLLELRT